MKIGARKYWSYFCYISKHKWLVFKECLKEGIILRGLLHDLSKFRPSEFFPYAKMYSVNFDDEALSATRRGRFRKAAALHYRRNDHHWQHWHDFETEHSREMSLGAMREMVCDLIGFAAGIKDAKPIGVYWGEIEGKIRLHKKTRVWLERRIGAIQ